MRKLLASYLGMTLAFGAGLALLLALGPDWIGVAAPEAAHPPAEAGALPFVQNLQGYLGQFLLQLILVVAASKGMGRVFGAIGLPRVVGEMFAGILLGPSLFGWVAPAWQAAVFPAASLLSLKALSQVGVIIFMFCVGVELDSRWFRKKLNTALMVSHFSIFLPFLLGVAVAIPVYRNYAPDGVDFTAFALFMGIAMSITAFPVLASIIRERNLGKTALGSTALGCAAIDDVTAWFILAGVVGFVRAEGWLSAAAMVCAALLYCTVMLWILRPRVAALQLNALGGHGEYSAGLMFPVLIFVLLSAWTSELIGIHALFGAFLAGVVLSGHEAIQRFTVQHIEPLAAGLLLPLFFCYSGLRTQLGLIDGAQGWLVCASVVALATLGKLGGGALAARVSGSSWREALSLGALMNTRGLMELVVLNIGLDLGVISPALFSIMVVMALVTTVMTGPLLSLFQGRAGLPLATARAVENPVAELAATGEAKS